MANKFILYTFILLWPILGELTIWDGGYGIPAVDLYRPLPIFFAFYVVLVKLSSRKAIKIDIVIISTFIFLSYFILNILINGMGDSYVRGIREILKRFIVPMAIYFTLINLSGSINRRLVSKLFILSGVYIALVGIFEFAAGRNIIGPIGFTGSSTIYRTNGPFWDVIGYAGVVLAFLPFTYYCHKEQLIGKRFAYFCMLIFTIGCLINFSRVIWITFCFILLIIIFGKNIKSAFLLFYGLIIFSIVVYFLFESLKTTEIFTSRIADTRNITQRYEQYISSLTIISEHPFFGIGYLMYWKSHPIQLHNSYLLVFVEFGIIGGILYLFHLLTLLLNQFRDTITLQGIHTLKFRLSILFLILVVPNTIDFLGNSYILLSIFFMTAIFKIKDIQQEKLA